MKHSKILSILIFFVFSMTIQSCDKGESEEPENPWINNPDQDNQYPPGNGDGDTEDIPGGKILGTWYYLNPNNALKITITFTSEKDYNYTIFKNRVCYVSVESEFPYFHSDYSNSWTYENSKWEITRIEVGPAISSSATIAQVFDNEMWLDLSWGYRTERLKFKRSDPGSPVKPTGLQLAPDGIFGNYLWETTISKYNLTFQFKGEEWTHETSNYDVMIINANGDYKYSRETDSYAILSNGYLKLDCGSSLIAAAAQSPYFVVVMETNKKLKLYNPLNPAVIYSFTRK